MSLQSKPIPVVRVEPKEPAKTALVDPPPATPPVEVPLTPPTAQALQKKQRLAGRTTKVQLQAVPRQEKQEKKIGKKSSSGMSKNEYAPVDEPQTGTPTQVKENFTDASVTLKSEKDRTPAREKLSGSAVFPQGQAEVTIANSHISPSSVVVVTLTGDPGPVVVQYISLLPEFGFTVHLSAPTPANTPFNYVILMGELF